MSDEVHFYTLKDELSITIMTKRAERRNHKRRIWKKLYTKAKLVYNDREEWAIHYTNKGLRTPCSCHMCGNPRKYYKQKTIQEQINGL